MEAKSHLPAATASAQCAGNFHFSCEPFDSSHVLSTKNNTINAAKPTSYNGDSPSALSSSQSHPHSTSTSPTSLLRRKITLTSTATTKSAVTPRPPVPMAPIHHNGQVNHLREEQGCPSSSSVLGPASHSGLDTFAAGLNNYNSGATHGVGSGSAVSSFEMPFEDDPFGFNAMPPAPSSFSSHSPSSSERPAATTTMFETTATAQKEEETQNHKEHGNNMNKNANNKEDPCCANNVKSFDDNAFLGGASSCIPFFNTAPPSLSSASDCGALFRNGLGNCLGISAALATSSASLSRRRKPGTEEQSRAEAPTKASAAATANALGTGIAIDFNVPLGAPTSEIFGSAFQGLYVSPSSLFAVSHDRRRSGGGQCVTINSAATK